MRCFHCSLDSILTRIDWKVGLEWNSQLLSQTVTQYGNYRDLLSHIFEKISSRQRFYKENPKALISRNIFSVTERAREWISVKQMCYQRKSRLFWGGHALLNGSKLLDQNQNIHHLCRSVFWAFPLSCWFSIYFSFFCWVKNWVCVCIAVRWNAVPGRAKIRFLASAVVTRHNKPITLYYVTK